MPYADEPCVTACPEPDSTARTPASARLARFLLIAAVGGGLLGLSSTHPGAATTSAQTVALSAASSSSPVQPLVLARADRSRHLLPGKRATAPVKTAIKKTGKKAHHGHAARPTWVLPSWTSIVSPFGMRWGRMHRGIDFGASYGYPIMSIGDGVVIGSGYLGDEDGYGLITIVRHNGGVYSAYAHQSRTFVQAGQRVHAGDIIGLVGSTGHSTGPHLHFEIRMSPHGDQVDPRAWLRAHHLRV